MITMHDGEVFVVESRAQLIAAVQAGARATFAMAREAPFAIRLGKTMYSFPVGVCQGRADQITANIKRHSPAAFKVAAE